MKSNNLKFWRVSLLGMTVLSLATASAFAATSDCKNPVAVKLGYKVRMKFCEIPAGSAMIGSEQGESDEKPAKKRDFKGFQMGQYTVTQQQYRVVVGEEPWKENARQLKLYVKEGNNNPAVYVSYDQANRFVRRMNRMDRSAKYRLPTEAEFEYAARAGKTKEYPWDEGSIPGRDFYYWGNSKGDEEYARDVTTCPLASLNQQHPGYCANGFGLMHMPGNVWQWTADAYVNSYADAPIDGNVAVIGNENSDRVIRGGAWNYGDQSLRFAERLYSAPDKQANNVGFRLVRIPR